MSFLAYPLLVKHQIMPDECRPSQPRPLVAVPTLAAATSKRHEELADARGTGVTDSRPHAERTGTLPVQATPFQLA